MKTIKRLIKQNRCNGKTECWLFEEDVLGLIDEFEKEYPALLHLFEKLKGRINGEVKQYD